jgi:hypothetical protein
MVEKGFFKKKDNCFSKEFSDLEEILNLSNPLFGNDNKLSVLWAHDSENCECFKCFRKQEH